MGTYDWDWRAEIGEAATTAELLAIRSDASTLHMLDGGFTEVFDAAWHALDAAGLPAWAAYGQLDRLAAENLRAARWMEDGEDDEEDYDFGYYDEDDESPAERRGLAGWKENNGRTTEHL